MRLASTPFPKPFKSSSKLEEKSAKAKAFVTEKSAKTGSYFKSMFAALKGKKEKKEDKGQF